MEHKTIIHYAHLIIITVKYLPAIQPNTNLSEAKMSHFLDFFEDSYQIPKEHLISVRNAIASNDEIEGIQVPLPPLNDEITQRLVRADFNGDYGRKFVLGDMSAIRLALQNDVMNRIIKTTCNNTVKLYNIQHQSNIADFRGKIGNIGILRVEGNQTGRDIQLPHQDFGAITNVRRSMLPNQMLLAFPITKITKDNGPTMIWKNLDPGKKYKGKEVMKNNDYVLMRTNQKSKSERYTAYAFSSFVWHRGTLNKTSEPRDLLIFFIDVGLPCGNGPDYPCLIKQYHLQYWPEAKSSTFAIRRHKGKMPRDYQKYLFEVSQNIYQKEHEALHTNKCRTPSRKEYERQQDRKCSTFGCKYCSEYRQLVIKREKKCPERMRTRDIDQKCDHCDCMYHDRAQL